MTERARPIFIRDARTLKLAGGVRSSLRQFDRSGGCNTVGRSGRGQAFNVQFVQEKPELSRSQPQWHHSLDVILDRVRGAAAPPARKIGDGSDKAHVHEV